ncbi:four helix bundle protein [Candidatus Peregrinibacteria bacterium]|nr:four helix bundle protein [Candidatus Peregrinibacteria bacterium]
MEITKEQFKEKFVQRAIKFSINVLNFCRNIRSKPLFWSIADQLIRSSTSIGANIVEARASSSRLDYIKYFHIALKSGNETKYWLILIQETSPEHKNQTDILYKEADELTKILAASLLTLKGKR